MDACIVFPRSNISLVIADPTAITSELLRQAFIAQDGFDVVGCPGNLDDLVRLVSDQAPDIVIIRSSGMAKSFSPISILQSINSINPGTRCIVLSSDLGRDDVVSYFHAQARGILSADLTDFATLCKCITCVHHGQIWASSEQLNYLIDSLYGTDPPNTGDERNG